MMMMMISIKIVYIKQTILTSGMNMYSDGIKILHTMYTMNTHVLPSFFLYVSFMVITEKKLKEFFSCCIE